MHRESKNDEYPAMRSMMGAYFNQDWDIICGSDDPDIALAQLREESSPIYLKNLIHDLEAFYAKYKDSDAKLAEALEREFTPEVHFYHFKGRTTREGITQAIKILSATGQGKGTLFNE